MNSTRTRSWLFYGACVVVLAIMVTKVLTHVLPGTLAHEIDDESEALPIAILFCGYLQYLRVPWTARPRDLWIVSGALAAAAWVVASLLLNLPLPAGLATLNESFVAVGAMILIACLPPAMTRRAAWPFLLSGALLVAVVVFESTNFVTYQAESVVPIILAPVALYWADRTILGPGLVGARSRRLIWCALLVIVPLMARAHLSIGSHHDVLHFERRATEGFVGLLLVHLYFSFWLGDRWASTQQSRLRTPRVSGATVSGHQDSALA